MWHPGCLDKSVNPFDSLYLPTRKLTRAPRGVQGSQCGRQRGGRAPWMVS